MSANAARFPEPEEDNRHLFGTYILDDGFYFVPACNHDRLIPKSDMDKAYVTSVEFDLERGPDLELNVSGVRVNKLNERNVPSTVKDPALEEVARLELLDGPDHREEAQDWLEAEGEELHRRAAA